MTPNSLGISPLESTVPSHNWTCACETLMPQAETPDACDDNKV